MTKVEFRDGERDVPDHVAVLMKGLETHTMTYEQAIRASERKMAADHANQAMADMLTAHFKGFR